MTLYNNIRDGLWYLNENAEKLLIYILYIYLVLMVVTNVFTRYVLQTSPVWSNESARFIYIYLSWIGVSWTAYKRQHIRLDLLHRFLPQRVLGMTYILGDIVMMIFVYYTIISFPGPILAAVEFQNTTQALGINQAFIKIAVPIGASLLLIRTVQLLIRDTRDVWNGNPVYKGEPLLGAD